MRGGKSGSVFKRKKEHYFSHVLDSTGGSLGVLPGPIIGGLPSRVELRKLEKLSASLSFERCTLFSGEPGDRGAR